MLLGAVLLLVSAHNLHSASVTKERAINMDIIRFPVEEEPSRVGSHRPARHQALLENRFGKDDVHESCRNQTFCTIMPPNYPEEKFNNLFKDYKIPPMPVVDVLGNRQGDPSYENGCETQPTFEPLYKVRTKRNEDGWRTVVQAPSHNFIQRIRLETCISTDSCFEPLLASNPLFETSCIQMNTIWELLVETLDGKGTETIKAELPTCCSCKYKETKFLSRFAETASSKSNKTKA